MKKEQKSNDRIRHKTWNSLQKSKKLKSEEKKEETRQMSLLVGYRRTDGPRDRPTDTPSFRVATKKLRRQKF